MDRGVARDGERCAADRFADAGQEHARAAVLDGDFDELCIARAGTKPGDVPENRRIIEQAQILTTHNLATLISAGITVDAERAAARCREARTSKPWVQARIDRQRIFFESLIGK